MTKPTPAQIEAAIAAYHMQDGDTLDDRMARALTAAAEVRQGAKDILHDRDSSWMDAAAEVGDQDVMTQSADVAQMEPLDRLAVAIKRIAILEKRSAATIERCAEIADSFHAYDRPAAEIAAAIRALKDK